MDKLSLEEAEAIRLWCVSTEGQQQIQALLDELERAVRVIRGRRRMAHPYGARIPVDNPDP